MYADNLCALAVQIPRPQQSREADIHPQSVRCAWRRWSLFLLDLLQHCRRVSRQHCWFHPSGILLISCLVQRKQG